MQYVEVKGSSHADALEKLRREHGSSTLIIEEFSRQAPGFAGKMRGKKEYIIKAMIRENEPDSPREKIVKTVDTRPVVKSAAETSFRSVTRKNDIGDFLKKLDHLAADVSGEPERARLKSQPAVRSLSPAALSGEAKVSEADKFSRLIQDIEFIKENLSGKSVHSEEGETQFRILDQALAEQDFSPEWRSEFISELKENVPHSEWKLRPRIYVHARELMAQKIRTNSVLGSRRMLALIGPTGVGKTTTLAKIAAQLHFQEGRKISLITLDNFRIAATEQLKIYGNIMNITVRVARDPQEFTEMVVEDRAEMLLIDNTGINQNNAQAMERQMEFFSGVKMDLEKYLTVSATSKPRDLRNIFQKYDQYGFDRIIITKTDETSTIGAVLELAMNYNTPIAFFTNGQNVPEDISEADRKELARMVLENFAPDMN